MAWPRSAGGIYPRGISEREKKWTTLQKRDKQKRKLKISVTRYEKASNVGLKRAHLTHNANFKIQAINLHNFFSVDGNKVNTLLVFC